MDARFNQLDQQIEDLGVNITKNFEELSTFIAQQFQLAGSRFQEVDHQFRDVDCRFQCVDHEIRNMNGRIFETQSQVTKIALSQADLWAKSHATDSKMQGLLSAPLDQPSLPMEKNRTSSNMG